MAVRDPEPVIVARLRADAAVAGIVVTRIRGLRLNQDDPLPAVIYRRVSTEWDTDAGGAATGGACQLQVDNWAASYDGAKALAKAVREALDGWSNETSDPVIGMVHIKNEMDGPEEPVEGAEDAWFVVTQDYYVEFTAP